MHVKNEMYVISLARSYQCGQREERKWWLETERDCSTRQAARHKRVVGGVSGEMQPSKSLVGQNVKA